MRFVFADSLDYVDPRYMFDEDRSPTDREPYWDDQFPHEYLGYAPYDGILVAAAAPEVPEKLLSQLAPGGVLIIPVGPKGQQELAMIRSHNGHLEQVSLGLVSFVPLVHGT